MDKIYIGKIVSTHGIKGEIKIISDFPYKEKAFLVGSKIEIANKKYQIASYRKHKNYDMITLDSYHDINDVLFLMKEKVYKAKEELNLSENEILDSDLMNYKVVTTDGREGIVKEIFYASRKNKIARIEIDKKEVLIPFSSPYMKEIDRKKEEIIITLIEGM